MSKDLTEDQLNEFFNLFYNYYVELDKFRKKNKLKIRLPNFAEGLSESIIKYFIINKEKRNCLPSDSGDLVINNSSPIKVEVKCFASNGPTSFGPKENWNEIYFLDATDFINKNFKIYKCNFSNNSDVWKNIKINNKDTFNDVCIKGKRPRINFNNLKNQLGDNIKVVFDGKIDNLFKNIDV